MKENERRDIDLEDTVELPVLQEEHIEKKDPFRIVFPVVSKIGILLAIILTGTLLLRAIYVYTNGEPLSLVDASKLVFSGVNGKGYADAMFHPESNAIKTLKEKQKSLKDSGKDTAAIDTLIDSISCSFDYSSNLSNGMRITYACSYNVEAAKEANYNITDTERSYTVMGLVNKEILDPFDNFNTEIDMEEDDIEILLEPDEKYTDLGITYNKNYNEDQTMTITIDYDADALSKQGYFIPVENRSKTIKVPYKTSIEEVDETIKEQTKEALLSKAENELYACDFKITFGKDTISTFNPVFESFVQNEDGTYDAIISVENVYSLSSLADYYHFTIEYHGYFVKDENGEIKFHTEENHGCTYDGYGNEYSIQTN